MIKEIKSSSGKSYKIDTTNIKCSCADWQFRRSHYPTGSMDHLCKHLKSELESHPELFPVEYRSKKVEFESDVVVMDDKVRYPRLLFDKYVKSLRILAEGCSSIDDIEICGSYRRLCDLVSDLDVLVSLTNPSNPHSIYEYYNKIKLAFPNHEVLAEGDKKSMIMIDGIIHVDIKVVPKESWGSALMHFTGPKVENIRLRSKASKLGYKLNEYGLWDGDNNLSSNMSESDIYKLLGDEYKYPWERGDH